MQEAMEKAAVLIEAMPYLQKFSGKEIVIKFGGSTMENKAVIDDILEDIVFLATVGIKAVLVHGGGKKISKAMDEAGIEPQFVAGLRVTDKAALDIVVDVLMEINGELVEGAKKHGGNSVSGFKDQISALKAKKKLIDSNGKYHKNGRDIGHVGEVVSVDLNRLRELEKEGDIIIAPPIGQDESGRLYNVNGDSAAAAMAAHIRAEKVVFLSDVHGIMANPEDPDSFLSSINRNQVSELIEQGIICGGMLPKVEGCLQAIESGVNKAHIIDGSLKHSLLLEIFTDAGVGTQIVSIDQ